MRTLRLSLVGTVILVLLGGLIGAVVGQSEQPATTGSWPRLETHIQYGNDSPGQQIIHVLRLEPRETPRPAVIIFHGGGLVFGDAIQDLETAEWIADQWIVTFMAGYRLFNETSGKNPWPTQLEDAQRAVRWIRAHADEFNIDPDRICAGGHSSGGHLAGLVGTTEAVDGSDPELAGISSRVNCVVSVSGDADLTVPYEDPYWTSVLEKMFGSTLEEDPAAWRAASPAWNVDEETPPFLVVHGNRDDAVPIQMARNLADALAAAGREFVYLEVPAGHDDIGDPEATKAIIKAFYAYQLHPER